MCDLLGPRHNFGACLARVGPVLPLAPFLFRDPVLMSLSRRAFCACLACGLSGALVSARAFAAASGAPADPAAASATPAVASPPSAGAPPPVAPPTPVLQPIRANRLIEPKLSLPKAAGPTPRVAVTLDACSGATDRRILDLLIAEEIPATFFVTGRWIRRNAEALALIAARPDLFEVENHGLNHVPAIELEGTVYDIAAAGSMEAVRSEVEEGARWIVKAGLAGPRWFRGATARYTPASASAIEAMGYRIAGYSLNADDGASVSARTAAKRLKAASDGDVIIAHVNQPTHAAGAGVAEGLKALKAKGAVFVKLDALEPEALAAVHGGG